MIRTLLLLISLAGNVHATNTPRMGMFLVPDGTLNWGVYERSNWSIMDSSAAVLAQPNTYTNYNTYNVFTLFRSSVTVSLSQSAVSVPQMTVNNSFTGAGTNPDSWLAVTNSSSNVNTELLALSNASGAYGAVGTQSNNPFAFMINNSTVARFSTAGNLLLNTTTDTGYGVLQASGTVVAQSTTSTPGAPIYNALNNSGTQVWQVQQNGRMGLGVASPNYQLDSGGDINTSTVYRNGGTGGVTTSCGSGQYLNAQTTSGGIVTGGACVSVQSSVTSPFEVFYSSGISGVNNGNVLTFVVQSSTTYDYWFNASVTSGTAHDANQGVFNCTVNSDSTAAHYQQAQTTYPNSYNVNNNGSVADWEWLMEGGGGTVATNSVQMRGSFWTAIGIPAKFHSNGVTMFTNEASDNAMATGSFFLGYTGTAPYTVKCTPFTGNGWQYEFRLYQVP